MDTPTPKQQIPAERWPQASAASLPLLSIATILIALIAIGYVVQLLI